MPVGTVMTWKVSVTGADPGPLWCRFRVHAVGQDYRMVKDFGPEMTLDWTATDHDGLYQLEATVRNTTTGETVTNTAYYLMSSRIQDGKPAVAPTSHPLVFLYSAPPCPEGARMKAQFTGPDKQVHNTPYQDCVQGLSMNFYLAGMTSLTQYSVNYLIDTGDAFLSGPSVPFTTSAALVSSVQTAPLGVGAQQTGILLQATNAGPPMASDLHGNLVWYYPGAPQIAQTGPFLLVTPAPGGYFWGIIGPRPANRTVQLLRKYDLTGMTVLQTNAARISEQLAAMGKRPIGSFTHEVRELPDGRIVALGSVEQIVTDVQGPGPVDVLGEMVVVLDQDLQVVWAWDPFDHLDPARASTTGDVCPAGGCPPLYLAAKANDWLHTNAVAQTPDGNLLVSLRHQDWVIKIDYQNGTGSGNILWRLGKDGDFTLDSTEMDAWFSHQHDAKFLPDNSTVILFDNGDLRKLEDPKANSRGQVLHLNERTGTASLVLNADLGAYCFALGSAQKLSNGNFHFNMGVLPDATSLAVEVDATGKPVYELHVDTQLYRSFRMGDIYTPPN